jgi:CubicO group peptidase (beta-lactamase class C family)
MSYESALSTVDSWPVSNVAAAVVTPEGVAATYGPADRVFPLASVTKPLVALTSLVAVEEGALEFGDPADETLIPGATIRHLLAHASGLAMDRPKRSFAPGVRRVYSNAGIDLLASLVESAVDMPFADYLDEALVKPLGLAATSLPGAPHAGGRSTVDDLARVVHELLAPSGWLHPTTLADATSVQYAGLRGVLPGFGAQDPNDWGLGFEIRGSKHPHWTGSGNSARTYGHFGGSGTMFWVDPAVALGVVVLTDEPFGPWAAQAWPVFSEAILSTGQ